MTALNAELAWKTLDHIDQHPELHNQGWWFQQEETLVLACYAGRAAMLAGAVPVFDSEFSSFSSYVRTPDGEMDFVGGYAERLLGVTNVQAAKLFYGGNTRDRLEELVRDIFGPRPVAAATN